LCRRDAQAADAWLAAHHFRVDCDSGQGRHGKGSRVHCRTTARRVGRPSWPSPRCLQDGGRKSSTLSSTLSRRTERRMTCESTRARCMKSTCPHSRCRSGWRRRYGDVRLTLKKSLTLGFVGQGLPMTPHTARFGQP
jgi:hypothetical protein